MMIEKYMVTSAIGLVVILFALFIFEYGLVNVAAMIVAPIAVLVAGYIVGYPLVRLADTL